MYYIELPGNLSRRVRPKVGLSFSCILIDLGHNGCKNSADLRLQ